MTWETSIRLNRLSSRTTKHHLIIMGIMLLLWLTIVPFISLELVQIWAVVYFGGLGLRLWEYLARMRKINKIRERGIYGR